MVLWCCGAVPIPHAPCLWVTCKGAHTRDRMTHIAICTHEAVSTPTEGELLKQNILLAIASAQLVLFRHHSSSPLLLPLTGRITCHHCNPTKKNTKKNCLPLCLALGGFFVARVRRHNVLGIPCQQMGAHRYQLPALHDGRQTNVERRWLADARNPRWCP